MRFRLQRCPKLPSKIVVHIFAKTLHIFNHQNKFFAQQVRGLQHRGAYAISKRFFAPSLDQIGMRFLQFLGKFGIVFCALLRKIKQCFKPEVGKIEYLVTFLHEPNRQKPLGKRVVRVQFCSDPRQEHGLALTARRHDQDMLARRRIHVAAENVEHDAKFALPDHELVDYFLIGLKCAWIKRADCTTGKLVHCDFICLAKGRSSRAMWWSRKRVLMALTLVQQNG